jgi:hypothetical protein
MNEYMEVFLAVNLSSQIVTIDSSKSREIQKSAKKLDIAIDPCLQELRHSAEEIKKYLNLCFNKLNQAEDTWRSKPNIIKIERVEIWNNLGILSGLKTRVKEKTEACKQQTLDKIKESWESKTEAIEKKHFFNEKAQKTKDSINLFEKEGVLKDTKELIEFIANELKTCFSYLVNILNQEVNYFKIDKIKKHINVLDTKKSSILNRKIDKKLNKITAKLHNSEEYQKIDEIWTTTTTQCLDDLNTISTFGMKLARFQEFEKVIAGNIQQDLPVLIDDFVGDIFKEIDTLITFYNHLLELQNRYQKEQPTYEAEKKWIHEQRQQLEKVQAGVDAILNSSV